MKIINPLLIILGLIALAYLGIVAAGLHTIFGVVIPYIALIVFLVGFIQKVIGWSKSPVPFRIPTTAGQGKTLPWIKQSKLDNPSSMAGVIGRMALEVLLFRSLFRNTKAEVSKDGKIAYGSSKWLWLGGMAFHWSMLVIVFRHLRLVLDPVPSLITMVESVDALFELAFLPAFYLTDAVILVAVGYLFIRRVVVPQIKYLSLPADYFAILLLFAVACTGVLMRYIFRVDVVAIKALARGLATFQPTIPDGIGVIFYIHLFLISVLLAYFPFSKLMHLGGVFLSPTRNLANNSRAKRHINPWNPDVKVRTYAEYEDDFRDKMKDVGLPVEKD